jgi:membrane protein YdbS with pleckstrin-like domain
METEIDIDRQKIVTYQRVMDIIPAVSLVLILGIAPAVVFSGFFIVDNWWDFRAIFLLFMSILGIIGVLVLVVYIFGFRVLPWFYQKRAKALRYCLVHNALRVESGVLFRRRKTIPYDKITGLELVQGPFLRYLDIWIIKIQTASTGAQTPEATLLGVINPEQVRDDILERTEMGAEHRYIVPSPRGE